MIGTKKLYDIKELLSIVKKAIEEERPIFIGTENQKEQLLKELGFNQKMDVFSLWFGFYVVFILPWIDIAIFLMLIYIIIRK